MTNLVGQEIAHYRLDALVGDGGMGTVYKAYDQNLERIVAFKLMHAHFARQPEFRARLTQEAKTAAQLDHPSIVSIYDFGESDNGLFIAMEYIGGGSLRAHLKRLQSQKSFLPLKQSLQVCAQIADALDYAHRRRAIHRDVKPSNIILKRLSRPDAPGEQPFRAVLTDFGLVKLLEGNSMTRSGTTLGTPTYMSPEQCEGLPLDGRSDLYSLGVVLYELLTNKLPFQFKSLSEAVATHLKGTMPTPALQLKPDLPPIVDNLLSRALSKKPENRFSTGREMADAMRAAMYSLEEMPTQVFPRDSQEDRAGAGQNRVAAGYRLRIETPGYGASYANLVRNEITIGRNADNDIVLPAEGVSRYHARLRAMQAGWAVIDLGGVNGTWLNGQRAKAEHSLPFEPGSKLEIGPYQLTLEGPQSGSPVPAGEVADQTPIWDLPTDAGLPLVASAASETGRESVPLEMFLVREVL